MYPPHIEEWRTVSGFEGIFEISNYGRVRNLQTGRILHGSIAHHAYRYVSLTVRQRVTSRAIHRLVAEAFLSPRPTPRHTVNHIDGDASNNHAANLEWMTMREQSDHAISLGQKTRNPRFMWRKST